MADWSYSEEKYPEDKDGSVKFLAELGISNFRGTHIEGSAVWSKQFYDERLQELEQENGRTEISLDLT